MSTVTPSAPEPEYLITVDPAADGGLYAELVRNRPSRTERMSMHGPADPIVRLSPADAHTTFVRHWEYVLRVGSGARELADTQFRFVPGLAGAGTESLRSVNFPDRYVRVVDGTVQIVPVAAGSPEATSASFRRVPRDDGGISLQLAGDATAHLRHDGGRLIVGPAAGNRTTFLR